MMSVVSKITHRKRFNKKYLKNGYSYNLKSFGMNIDFHVNFVDGFLSNEDGKDVYRMMCDKCRGLCGYGIMMIPISAHCSFRQDLDEVNSILIHEFTHCYQHHFSESCFDWDDDKEWIERECEQEAILNQFKFDLENGKDFNELIKVGNYKNLYKINPKMLENLKRNENKC